MNKSLFVFPVLVGILSGYTGSVQTGDTKGSADHPNSIR